MTLGCHGRMKILLGKQRKGKRKMDLDLGEMVGLAGARFVHGLYPEKGGGPGVCDCRPSQLRTGL